MNNLVEPLRLDRIRRHVVFSLLLGFLVLVALALYGDLRSTLGTLSGFQWAYVPAIVGLTLLNYGLRFVKWRYYLKLIGVSNVSSTQSLLVFLSGFSMVLTPGKVGEWLKSYLLRELAGTPISRSAPIVIAERLTDGLAMLLLALAGVLLFDLGVEIVAVMAIAGAVVVLASQHRPTAIKFLQLLERVPLLDRFGSHLREFYESSNKLLRPRSLLLAVSLGFVSWGAEGVAFYLVFLGLGAGEAWLVADAQTLLIAAVFILAVSTLAGAMFLVPGGLGVAEGGMTALAQLVLAAPREVAVAATMIIRLCTLWFGVAIGFAALFLCFRWIGKRAAGAVPERHHTGRAI